MKIPKKIQIAGQNYDIIFDSDVARSEQVWGRIYSNELKIILEKPSKIVNKNKIEESFIHECLHAICYATKIDLSEDDIGRFSELLYQVFKQIEDK